ncbi:MAG: UDP-N-acetylmuramoyl-tripeptide--D-alanyl-D-alanine ligase [Planctomycetota bacterium]|nr:UDP-N-acetylmuramoyl-tripeptide--D-alanyl-D-alanine ligase [Planctomycetota bacterium]
MKAVDLDQIRQALHGRWVARGEGGRVSGVTIDTRTARAGELFVAIKGKTTDGHAFLPAAAAAGCKAAVIRTGTDLAPRLAEKFTGGLIAADDTTTALGDLAAFCRQETPATVIAVTGSNGKTTVKRMIHHILQRRMTGSASPRSYNNEFGVPLTLLATGPGDDYVVCEVGTNAPGEIIRLAAIARPDIAVITSVGPTHLEGLGSEDRVAVEKAALFSGLQPGGMGVVWADSDKLSRAVRAYDVKIVSFGECPSAQVRLTGWQRQDWGQRFQVNGRFDVVLPVPGRHNALNALAAITVAQRLGFDVATAAGALADFVGEPGRLERLEAGPVTIINDAYNANPASVLAAGDVLGGCEGPGRRVMVVGDMRELGPESDRLHRETGELLARKHIHLLVGVGALGRTIARAAADAGSPVEAFDTLAQAQKQLPALLRPGDIILLKGSRAMALDKLVETIRSAFADGGARPKPPARGKR